MIKRIIKRSGKIEAFDAEKLAVWASWAAEAGADWSLVLREAYKKLEEDCTSEDLQEALIAACLDKESTAYNKMAGRLYMGNIYKRCFGSIDNIPTLSEMYNDMVELGFWEDVSYSEDELVKLNDLLDHERDLNLMHSQAKQIVGKYSVQDKVNGQIFETPQFTFMRMALALAKEDKSETRLEDVEGWFYHISRFIVNAPTPNYSNLCTSSRAYASCCLVTAGDNLGSQAAANHIVYNMSAASAGIGMHYTSRSAKDPVRGGIISHSGKVPYFKATKAMVGANLQGSRGGSATVFFPVSDPEVNELIPLRNPKTVASKKVDGLDYSLGVCEEFTKRVALDEDWSLFSYYDYPELYENMYSEDSEGFAAKLSIVEGSDGNKLTKVSARRLVLKSLQEAQETGRFYDHDITELNRHTPFKETIHSSNLCSEIAQPTKPYSRVDELYREEESGEVSLCNLSAIIQGNVDIGFNDDGSWTKESLDNYERACYYALKMIDNIIDIMDYPYPQVKYTAQRRRNAGVGISNLAHDMAKRGLKYSSKEGKAYIHRLAELHSYSLHRASLKLAKERGVCEWMYKTKYPEGWLPINTYKRNIDSKAESSLWCDWETLRQEIIENGGIRHSVLEAHMPAESSSLASNTTNSVYPIRDLVVLKTDGNKKLSFMAPDMEELADSYEIAWNVPTKDMVEVYAILQKFCGQAISADYWPKRNSDNKFSADEALEDWLYARHLGIKTRYYTNTRNNGDLDVVEDKGCAGGSCTL